MPKITAGAAIAHPLDLFVSLVRQSVAPEYPATAARHAAVVGVCVAYASMLCLLIEAASAAWVSGSSEPIRMGLALATAIFVLQFVSCRLLAALETLIVANQSKLGSLAVPDTACVTVLLFTIVGAVGGAISAFMERSPSQAEAAFVWLLIGLHAACVAVRPWELGFVIDPGARVAEEAVGVALFFVRLVLRCVPMLFAVGIILGTMHIAVGFFQGLQSDIPLKIALAGLHGWRGRALLFSSAALPLLAYVLALIVSVSLDVVSAIVSIPAKLDSLGKARADVAGQDSKPVAVADTERRP